MRALVPNPLVVGVRALGIGQPGQGCLRAMAMWQPGDGVAAAGERARGRLLGQAELWETVQANTSAFDEGYPKPRGEFLVSASAWSAEPVTELLVSTTLGPVRKVLHVFGERFWSGSSASKPLVFTEMPLSWERALGGPKDPRNPVGRGQVEDEQIGAVLLPNVELPMALVRGPRDRPPPASFGPRPSHGLPRREWLGTMNEAWIDSRYPEMPDDFDPRFAMQASEDQWAPEFWRGDEAFSLLNLHPDTPRWEGALPGLRARAWIRRRRQPDPAEVPLALDTVWFLPHQKCFALMWRGLFELFDDDELELSEVLAALEWLDAPREDEHYAAARERRAPRPGGDAVLDDSDLLPPELAIRPPAPEEPTAPDGPDVEAMLAEMKELVTSRLRLVQEGLHEQREQLLSQGQPIDAVHEAIEASDPDAVWQAMVDASKPPADGERREPITAEANLEATRAKLQAEGASDEELEDIDKTLAQLGAFNASMESAMAAGENRVGPPELPTAREQIDVLAMLGNLKQEAGARYTPEIEAQIVALTTPALTDALSTQEDQVRERYRSSAHLQGVYEPRDRDGSEPRRAEVLETLAAGGSLHRWDLTGIDLEGIDFSGADLSEAWLESANLSNGTLTGCNLQRAVLTRARLEGADLSDADLREANLGGVHAERARFDRAKLTQAILTDAQLGGASLAECVLADVDLSGALVERASFRGCAAAGLVMTESNLSRCDFRDADVSGANFTACRLNDADFRGAKLAETLFFACQGDGANFEGAQALNMRFSAGEGRSSFAGAKFRDAMLDRACLGDSVLRDTDFRGCSANGALFSSSDLSGANFDGVPLQGAIFERAILHDASFIAADLMDARLMRARVEGASFAHANLFGIDTLRLRLDERTSFEGANLEGVRFFQPVRVDGPQRS